MSCRLGVACSSFVAICFLQRGFTPGEGGGYSVWKRVQTAVRLLSAERWLLRPKMAKKKGDCPLIILYNRGAVRVFASNILHQIRIVCIKIGS